MFRDLLLCFNASRFQSFFSLPKRILLFQQRRKFLTLFVLMWISKLFLYLNSAPFSRNSFFHSFFLFQKHPFDDTPRCIVEMEIENRYWSWKWASKFYLLGQLVWFLLSLKLFRILSPIKFSVCSVFYTFISKIICSIDFHNFCFIYLMM